MTDENDYVSHVAVSSKAGWVQSEEAVKVIDRTGSRLSLQIMATDGEPANTGVDSELPVLYYLELFTQFVPKTG